jgi:excisionase family DNA binding protein
MWMTLEETAVYLKVSKETLYRLVQQGKLPGSKLGCQWRFHRERLDEWLYSQGQTNPISGSELELKKTPA